MLAEANCNATTAAPRWGNSCSRSALSAMTRATAIWPIAARRLSARGFKAPRMTRNVAETEGVYPKPKDAPSTPGMIWVSIGIAAERFGEISELIELMATVDGIRIDTHDDGQGDVIEIDQAARTNRAG